MTALARMGSMNEDIILFGPGRHPGLPFVLIVFSNIALDVLNSKFINIWIMMKHYVIRLAGNNLCHVTHMLERSKRTPRYQIIADPTKSGYARPAVHPIPPKFAMTTASAKWVSGSTFSPLK